MPQSVRPPVDCRWKLVRSGTRTDTTCVQAPLGFIRHAPWGQREPLANRSRSRLVPGASRATEDVRCAVAPGLTDPKQPARPVGQISPLQVTF